jgi:teichuronic acid biosynthesis glycosyltransferase TuaC
MLRVLTLATLFPDSSRPTFGPFVERQTLGLAAHPDVDLKVLAPIGVAPWPISRAAHYAPFQAVPLQEVWKGVDVYRPRFLHLPGLGGRFDAGALTRATLPMLKALRATFPFDVIDAQFFFPDGPAAVALGKALGVPVSIKARGSDIHFWGEQAGTAAQVLAAGQQADGVLAVSGALKEDMVALGMAEARICVHHTGLDHALFQPLDRAAAKATLGIAGPLVVSIGTLMARKGQHYLIDALTQLPDATLVLIGRGPDRSQLEAQTIAAGVADRVRFTGAIPQAEIARWLGAADAMALISASEGLANVWLEALACGTPVVTTDVGGAREVVAQPVAGHLVPPEPGAIVTALSDLFSRPRDQAAVRALSERFSWDRNRDTLYDHLRGLVGQR